MKLIAFNIELLPTHHLKGSYFLHFCPIWWKAWKFILVLFFSPKLCKLYFSSSCDNSIVQKGKKDHITLGLIQRKNYTIVQNIYTIQQQSTSAQNNICFDPKNISPKKLWKNNSKIMLPESSRWILLVLCFVNRFAGKTQFWL